MWTALVVLGTPLLQVKAEVKFSVVDMWDMRTGAAQLHLAGGWRMLALGWVWGLVWGIFTAVGAGESEAHRQSGEHDGSG